MSGPVAQFFVDYASLLTPANYIGRSADKESRYVMADRWQATTGMSLPNSRGGPATWTNFTVTFFSSVAAPGIGGAEPIRIKLAGTSYQKDPLTGAAVQSTARVFFHQYEFLDFAFGAPEKGTFDIPAHIQQPCLQRSALPSNFGTGPLPRKPALVLPVAEGGDATTAPSARSLANSFAALLEAKVWPNSTGEDVRQSPTVYVVEWSLDRAKNRESIRRLQADGSVQQQIVIYESFPTKGTAHTQGKDGACTSVAFDTTTATGSAAAAAANAPLLWSHFSGALQSALVADPEVSKVGAPGSLAFVSANSFDIQSERGVVADRFSTGRNATAAVKLSYSSEFFQTNAGWSVDQHTGLRPLHCAAHTPQ